MRNLWTFGCSFTAEYYPIDLPNNKSLYDDYKKWKGYLPKVWPTLLSEKLNCDLKNMAWGGESNYGILNRFFDVCNQIKEDDIVIFGWTHCARFVAVNMVEENFQQILPSMYNYPGTNLSEKTIKEILHNRTDKLWIKEVENWIKFINLYFEKINGNVFHWTSDFDIFNKKTDFIDFKRFIVVTDPNHAFNHDLMTYISNTNRVNGKEVSKIIHETSGEVNDCHFGEYGHIAQSEYFYKHIINYI
jgi:hypothetical protein